MLYSYTDLLGETLISAGFALIGDERHEFIYLGDTLIKKYRASRYSLKAIKRWCRCYLRDQTKSGHKIQLAFTDQKRGGKK